MFGGVDSETRPGDQPQIVFKGGGGIGAINRKPRCNCRNSLDKPGKSIKMFTNDHERASCVMWGGDIKSKGKSRGMLLGVRRTRGSVGYIRNDLKNLIRVM